MFADLVLSDYPWRLLAADLEWTVDILNELNFVNN